MLKKIVVASNNSAKTKEIADVFSEFNILAVNYREFIDEKIFPEETTNNQYQNALTKAQYIQQFLPHEAILADDTGAYFKAFPNRFGLNTARELKALKLNNIQEENDYILSLYDTNSDRTAYLEALFVLLFNDVSYSSTGRGGVMIAQHERGDYAKGFDKLFESENGKTFAEMPMGERVIYSHRGRAARELLEKANIFF